MTALRKELHEYANRSDENFMRVLRAVIEEHLKTKPEEEVTKQRRSERNKPGVNQILSTEKIPEFNRFSL